MQGWNIKPVMHSKAIALAPAKRTLSALQPPNLDLPQVIHALLECFGLLQLSKVIEPKTAANLFEQWQPWAGYVSLQL